MCVDSSRNSPDERDDSRDTPPERDDHRVLVEGVPNGILALFDAEFRLRVVGPKTLPVSGDCAATRQGRTIDEIYPPDVLNRLKPAFEATLAGEFRRLDIDHLGRTHRVETAPTSIDSEPHGVVLTQDVTDERDAQEEQARQRRQLEAFASVVSHDLRNPLAIAKGYLDLANDYGDDSALARVDRALVRMEEIIDDLLTATEPRDQWRPNTTVNIATVAAEAWEMVATEDATLVAQTDLVVDGNRSSLRRLFENLFRNCVEHGSTSNRTAEPSGDSVEHANPTVNITVTVDTDSQGFVVEDDGPGIDPTRRERVFQPGYSTDSRGTGLGLFIVRDIALAHGWDVRLGESDVGGFRLEFRVEASRVADDETGEDSETGDHTSTDH